MPKTIETTVYTFDELSDKAKDKAREWFKDGYPDYEWHSYVSADFEEYLTALGFENVATQFSGFWSQGDGASFDFKGLEWDKLLKPYEPDAEEKPDQYNAVKYEWENTYKDAIAEIKAFLEYDENSIFAEACKNSYATHYCHARTRYMSCNPEGTGGDDKLNHLAQLSEKVLFQLYYRLSSEYYQKLEREYEWLMADEQIDDNIKVNEYTFTESGKRFG